MSLNGRVCAGSCGTSWFATVALSGLTSREQEVQGDDQAWHCAGAGQHLDDRVTRGRGSPTMIALGCALCDHASSRACCLDETRSPGVVLAVVVHAANFGLTVEGFVCDKHGLAVRNKGAVLSAVRRRRLIQGPGKMAMMLQGICGYCCQLWCQDGPPKLAY